MATLRERIISAGRKAVEELIKVAEEEIIVEQIDEGMDIEQKSKAQALAADRLKNAAAAKKLAIFDAFEILERVEAEEENIRDGNDGKNLGAGGFAENRAR